MSAPAAQSQTEADEHPPGGALVVPSPERPPPVVLEELFVEYFRLYERRLALHQDLYRAMTEGFLRLGKARYVQGTKTISALSYDMNMKTHYRIRYEEDSLSLHAANEGEEDESDDDEEEEPAKPLPSVLRHRTRGGGGGRQQEQGHEQTKRARGRSRDPAQWFGVLSCPPLRAAQACFKQATSVAAALASVSYRMDLLQRRYLALAGPRPP